MDDSFEEIMSLVERIKALHTEMKDPQVVELAKLITYNQMWLDVTGMISEEMVH